MEEDGQKGALGVVTRGKSWLRHMLNVPHVSTTQGDGFESGSPDFSASPSSYNLIKRGSLTTQDLHHGSLLGYDLASRRGSDFRSIEDYSTELVRAEDTKKDEFLLKLEQMSATLKEYEESPRTNTSDEEIFSFDVSPLSQIQEQPEPPKIEIFDTTQTTIGRFLPNNWLFAKDEAEEEDKEKPKSRKTSDGTEPAVSRSGPITKTAKTMLERRELNVFVPQGM